MKTRYLIIILLFTLSACGFHLRGSQQKSVVKVAKIYISQNAAASVADQVKSQLAGAGAKAVSSADKAKFILRLEKEIFDRNVLSVSAETGKVEEYQLMLTVYLSLLDAKGKDLIVDEQIRLTRDYVFDEDAVLGKFEEEQILRDELAVQAASQIIRRLNAETGSR